MNMLGPLPSDPPRDSHEVSKKTFSFPILMAFTGLVILSFLMRPLLGSLSFLILCLLVGLGPIFLKWIKRKIWKEPENEDPMPRRDFPSGGCIPSHEELSWDRYAAWLSVLKTEGYVEHYLKEFERKCGRQPTNYEYEIHFWEELYGFFTAKKNEAYEEWLEKKDLNEKMTPELYEEMKELSHQEIEERPELEVCELSCRATFKAKVSDLKNLAESATFKAEIAEQKNLAELEYEDKKGKKGGDLQWALWRRKHDNKSTAEYMDDLLESFKSLALKREADDLNDREYLDSLIELHARAEAEITAYLDHEEWGPMQDRIIDTVPEKATVKYLQIKEDDTN